MMQSIYTIEKITLIRSFALRYSQPIESGKQQFTVDDAVEALGFGKFQLKLSILTGIAWVGLSNLA